MVQNAGFVLKNGQSDRRERLEIGVLYLLFNHYFALFNHVFHGSKRFYLYHFSGYLCFSPRILQHLALHFAPFYLAFSTKTHCI